MPETRTISVTEELLTLATGLWTTRAIYVAAELKISDLLSDGPKTITTLAEESGANSEALYRVLRALAGMGIFAEQDDGRFGLTPLANLMRTGVPGSLRPFIIMMGNEQQSLPWSEALYSVKTGKPAFDHVFGKPHFQYFSKNPDAARIFNEAMTSRSAPEDAAILSAYDFSRHESIVDVGGGHGSFLAAILDAHAGTKGILFDMPHVISTAQDKFSQITQAERLACHSGDFFESVPDGGDAYILKKVVHNWDDERATTILSKCRNAIADHGRLLVIEPVVPPGNQPSFNKILDLQMLVWTSMGKERTEAEHRDLLFKAGFKLERAIETPAMVTVLDATPI